jgi:hypothetical protein
MLFKILGFVKFSFFLWEKNGWFRGPLKKPVNPRHIGPDEPPCGTPLLVIS